MDRNGHRPPTEELGEQEPELGSIPFGPVPTLVSLGHFGEEGRRAGVVLLVSTPIGQAMYFLSPETCETLAPQLVHHARQCDRTSPLEIVGELPPEMRR